jgi:hypothetical protein
LRAAFSLEGDRGPRGQLRRALVRPPASRARPGSPIPKPGLLRVHGSAVRISLARPSPTSRGSRWRAPHLEGFSPTSGNLV